VVVDVLSTDAARIPIRAPATIDGWGGDRPLTGRVRLIEPSATTKISALGIEEQRVDVVIALDDQPPALGDGYRVEVSIQLWHGDDVLTVPAGALFRDRGRWAVYAIAGGRAHLTPIDVGRRGRTAVEVTGLAPGTPVIIHPSDRVRDGARVAPRGP
jgi:HlyD family secretion protein